MRHPWLYALPGATLPARVTCSGVVFDHVETFKHDFFAATGLYRGPDGLAVLKMGRTSPLLFVPMRWAGRFLTRREVALYRQVQDLPGVPRLIGAVEDTGFLHAFVPGHPLARREVVDDDFFPQLQTLLAALHARHIAYVDLNKRQNVLRGDDGRPYLIDFQISLCWPPTGWRGLRLARWLLSRFQHADVYHCLKHKRRLRPDQLTATERAHVERLSIWIRLHRLLTRPLTHLRRRALRRLQAGDADPVPGAGVK